MSNLLLVLAILFGAAGSAPHPDSRSSSLIVVRDRSAQLELQFQERALFEAVALDSNADGEIDPGELAAGQSLVAAYLLDRFQLFAATEQELGRDFDDARALVGRATALRLIPAAESAVGEARVVANFEFDAPLRIEALTLRVRIFLEQNPYHRDEARLEFQGDLPARHLFAGDSGQVWHYRTEGERRPGVFGDYWREGLRHIAAGWDHLAFLLALVLCARRGWSVLWVVTAFTLAHTLTLALATFELVSVGSELVEMAIALSIAYVGALNLISKQPSARWIEAFVFGLVHGLGFAGALQDSLAFEPLRITALLGFNLGVECGQLAIVMPLGLMFVLLPGARVAGDNPRAFLAPRWLRVLGSTAVILAGLFWFAQRAGFAG